jgi:hypothetical protein
MANTLDIGKSSAFLRAACCAIVRLSLALGIGASSVSATRATDIFNLYPAGIDSPRIYALLRDPTTDSLYTSDGEFAFPVLLDTGASGAILSRSFRDALNVPLERYPDPATGQIVIFGDVGVGGTDEFNVSHPVKIQLASNYSTADPENPASYIHTQGPLRLQISMPTDNPFIQDLNIFGMPTMRDKVVVMDPTTLDLNGPNFEGQINTWLYDPGTPFKPATLNTDPGIPSVGRHVRLSYGEFGRFTEITPDGAPGATLSHNPFIGPNPALQLEQDPPPDDTPPVRISYGDFSSSGSFLLDTGAAVSMISLEQAANLHIRYRPGTEGTSNPQLETFDPMNPAAPGSLIPAELQYDLDVTGFGGTVKRSGFYLDSFLVPTIEGNAANPDDPNHLRYMGAPVLVSDITLQDPVTADVLTLDGIFGMNFLVASAFIDGLEFDVVDGPFRWLTYDEPNGILGLEMKAALPAIPNEWFRSNGGLWATDSNWSLFEAPDSNSSVVLLGGQLLASGSVDIQNTDRTVKTLRFAHQTASYNVTSTGTGRLVLESDIGAATIQFDFGNNSDHTISAPLHLKSNVDFHGLFDDLDLTLSGGQSWDSGKVFAVRSGRLRYNLDQNDQVISDGDNTLLIDAGAAVELAGTRTPLSGSHSILATVTHIDVVNNSAEGLLVTAGNHAAGAVIGDGSTSISNAASFSAEVIRQSSLSINAGSRVTLRPGGSGAGASVLGTLSLAGTPASPSATLDLSNNSAIINYTGASPVTTIRQQITAGRGGAGLGHGWNGTGITSSIAAAANATDPESRSVGYAENSAMPLGPLTTFRGQPVDATSVLITFTRTGDANLDGVVNDDDVTIVGATYAPGVPQPSWALGDFDYNGFVDDDDVTLLGVFYDPSAPPLAAPTLPSAAGVAAVPEPGTVALLVTGLVGILLAMRVRRKPHLG